MHSDGKSFIHIEPCPTPKNKTIDFMRYGGYPEPQNVYGGKSALRNLDLWEPSPAKFCEEFHVSVICQKGWTPDAN